MFNRTGFSQQYRTDSSAANNTTTATTLLSTQILDLIETPKEIYDPRITRPFAFICLFVGSIGNSLSFIVFSQKQLRIHATFRYLAYLSIVDLIVLYLGLGNIILRDFLLFDIRAQNLVFCKIHTFLTYVTTQLSSWILTIVSIDRAIASTVVQLNKHMCRPKNADRIIIAMCIIVSLINGHILLFMGSKHQNYVKVNNISSYQEIVECTHNTSAIYFQFFEKPYTIIDLLSYVLIPFIIMTVCSGIITYRLFFSLNRTKMLANNKNKTHKGTRRAKQISYMLLVLNLVFVVLLTPIVIGQIFQELNQEHHYRLYNSITLLMSYSNHALNFVLYGIASPQFRLTLRQLLGFDNIGFAQRRTQIIGINTSTAL